MKCLAFALILSSQMVFAQPANEAANPVMASTRPNYEQVRDYLLRSVEQMPEDFYGFRPTPEVRTFGQIIGHLATEQNQFCSAALVEKNPDPQNFEKTQTTKTGLAAAILASFRYCDRAYQLTDTQAVKRQAIPGWGERAPLSILVLNIGHDNEHYGNIVTYMRLKGMVPPSSQPSK